jgi:hypothetical protein
MTVYDRSRLYFALGAMRERIESGEEFRLRQLWTIGNVEAGWNKFDDATPCVKESWNLVNEYRKMRQMKSRKSGSSRIWRHVKQ